MYIETATVIDLGITEYVSVSQVGKTSVWACTVPRVFARLTEEEEMIARGATNWKCLLISDTMYFFGNGLRQHTRAQRKGHCPFNYYSFVVVYLPALWNLFVLVYGRFKRILGSVEARDGKGRYTHKFNYQLKKNKIDSRYLKRWLMDSRSEEMKASRCICL